MVDLIMIKTELEDDIHDVLVNLLYDTKANFTPTDIDVALQSIMELINNE